MKITQITKAFTHQFSFFMGAPAVVWQILFFYLPILFLIYLSCSTSILSSTIFTSSYCTVLFRSIMLAFFNACACFLFAFPIAYFLSLHVPGKFKNICLFLLNLPFCSGLLILIHAWFFVLEKHGLINSVLLYAHIINEPLSLLNNYGAIALVMVYCYLPFMVMPIYTVLEKLDRKLLEASFDLGAGHWTTMLKVTLPLSMPGIKTGFFLVLIPSFGEFVIPELIGGNKQFFIGSLISYYFLEAHNPALGATYAMISLLVLFTLIGCLYWISTRYIRSLQTKGNNS